MTRRVAREASPETRRALAGFLSDDRLLPHLADLRAHHAESFAHCVRVGLICLESARELYDSHEERLHLGRAGLLHDIGKVRIRSEVLGKPCVLDRDERLDIQDHTLHGFEALRDLDHEPTRLAVLAHHRFGSRPYPAHPALDDGGDPRWSATDRRLGVEMAQVVAVADIVDALSTRRAYKGALDSDAVAALLDREFVGDRAYVDCVLGSAYVKRPGTS